MNFFKYYLILFLVFPAGAYAKFVESPGNKAICAKNTIISSLEKEQKKLLQIRAKIEDAKSLLSENDDTKTETKLIRFKKLLAKSKARIKALKECVTPTSTPTASPTTTPTFTPTATATPTQTPTPTSTQLPIPGRAVWEAQMLQYGVSHGENLNPATGDPALAATYYDAQEVFLRIFNYTHDARFLGYAGKAEKSYRDQYVIFNNGGVPGYWNFTPGLRRDFEMHGDNISKNAVYTLSQNAAYASPITPINNTSNASFSREVAYAIRSAIDAEKCGFERHVKLTQWLDQAFSHLDQLLVQKTDPDWAPFMVGLTARSLIMYYEEIQSKPEIIDILETAAQVMWSEAWVAKDKSFWYRAGDRTNGAPDLNLLIAPMYAWLYKKTGNEFYRDVGDTIFEGGLAAWLAGPKQFNQNYTWSFEYVKWRS